MNWHEQGDLPTWLADIYLVSRLWAELRYVAYQIFSAIPKKKNT
jgi:hypothetical protein